MPQDIKTTLQQYIDSIKETSIKHQSEQLGDAYEFLHEKGINLNNPPQDLENLVTQLNQLHNEYNQARQNIEPGNVQHEGHINGQNKNTGRQNLSF